MSAFRAALSSAVSTTPRSSKVLKYGTAGFRDRADLPLDGMFLRVGILAVLRSRSASGQTVGVMITASHNDECDNGVKVVDPDGGMLSSAWEPLTELLANASTPEAFSEALTRIESSQRLAGITGGVVMVGRDTRPHSAGFLACVRKGVEAAGGTLLDLGVATTPQLHFAVQRANEAGSGGSSPSAFSAARALTDYYSTLAGGFSELLDSATGTPPSAAFVADGGSFSVVVDGSCGVGASAVSTLVDCMVARGERRLAISLRNNVGSGPVNAGCGAELVQKQQVPPKGVSSVMDAGKLMCSFDGDADRIVFHIFPEPGAPWVLLDGDKIAALMAVLLVQELREAGLSQSTRKGGPFSLGVVQTAYANGASTAFLRSQGVAVAMAKTGVKFLHHEALAFDVGVYFEANGHGTVLFSKRLRDFLDSQVDCVEPVSACLSNRQELALRRLHACTRVINQAVGDALSDLLATLACLRVLGLGAMDWSALFADLPSRQLKQVVGDKSAIVCSDDETRVVQPPALAAKLAAAMGAVEQGRCFVRPSGTEDVVRVYAEAKTQAAADALAEEARLAVLEFCK